MLTYWRVRSAFNPGGAWPSDVIQGFKPLQSGEGFIESPISALRFVPRSLRRTESTPRSAELARLELGL
jgi:hypothetical protein